jgi:hypothetical protein
LKKALDLAWFVPTPLHRVAQLDPFELFPQALAQIEFGGACRQALQVHSLVHAMSQDHLDDLTAIYGSAIPDDDHAAGDFANEMLQRGNDISRVHRVILRMKVELAIGRRGDDRREVITGSPLLENWRVAYQRIGVDNTGQG